MHYLANTQFFSVLTRESLMFFNYSFQAMVLSAIYSTMGEKSAPYTHY
jgi:glycosylphosphatidylinositol transamidase (GPIT) subunit GPI8